MEKLKKQDIAAGTIRNAIKSKQARTKLKQNKALKPISETVVSDMQKSNTETTRTINRKKIIIMETKPQIQLNKRLQLSNLRI